MSLALKTPTNWLDEMIQGVYRALPVILPVVAVGVAGVLGYYCYKGNNLACEIGCSFFKSMSRQNTNSLTI